MPTTLRGAYEDQCVNYYFNWPCNNRLGTDADCNDYRSHMEMISEHRDSQGRALRLDHWGYGQERAWRVFYDPLALGTPGCSCTEEVVGALSADPDEQAEKRVPMSMMAPCEVGKTAYGALTCSAVYTYGTDGQGNHYRGYDAKFLGRPESSFTSVGLYFARVTLLGYLEDPGSDCNVAHLLNEYFTTECDRVDSLCQGEHPDDPACEKRSEFEIGARRFNFRFEELGGKLYVPTPPDPGTPTATPGPETCADCDVTFCLDAYEDYYVRQVPATSRLENGEYRNNGGMLRFWLGQGSIANECPIDQCPYWYIDPTGGAGADPTPAGSPAPTPTAGGGTATPLPLEHEDWHTRCPKYLPGCNPTPPVPTRTPGGPECPTSALATAYPQTTSDPANGCGLPEWPASTEIPASRTPPPAATGATPPARLTPIPTATGNVTCAPSQTPSVVPTNTYTPTLTLTPTNTATMTPTLTATATPSPMPTCGSQSASEACGDPESCAMGACEWEAPPISPPELACDTAGPYEVTITATECDTAPPFSISEVLLYYQENGAWIGPHSMSQYAPGPPRKWRVTLTLAFKPTHFKLTWDTWSSGQQTRGIKHIDIDYCCQ